MPLFYLRRLTGSQRSEKANRHLARYLAFIAGATNAGGLLAVGHYTSHMSGIISTMADDFALTQMRLVFDGFVSVLSFLAGAFLTTLLVRWARARQFESEYALPLIIEAGMLIVFGTKGRIFTGGHVLGIIVLLCFTMGLQNAIISKISDSVIRTTHLTGMVTDIGIALGRIFSRQYKDDPGGIDGQEEWSKLRLLGSLIVLFFVGGVTGALGFKYVGFLFTLPLAAILMLLAIMPVVDDIHRTRHPAI
ncbi:YoaK family protein [Edaphobacter albus]|uniref:YoaK family protein n=1 Tax=Edaphobacter sp. 4G125 TaxID=2763071 RepID=UPI0016496BA3|nr:YoaK family protein [Edaphobacter sp. 4G125]QNI36860.1 DUF1275 domain-containing protein [Edaphobacter sp. 4G125]